MGNRLRIVLSFFVTALFVVTLQGATQTQQASQDEQAIWKLEHSYWDYVQQNDLQAYRALWDKDFLGWPSMSAAPVRKDHITDWITAQTSKGLAFKTVEFKPAALHVHGDVAVTYYWITDKWVDKEGKGAADTSRITHTWIRSGKDWHIIGGMSMAEGANAGK